MNALKFSILVLVALIIFSITSVSAISLEQLREKQPSTNITYNLYNSTINGTGPAGSAATINVNHTFTGSSGTNANVVNIGNQNTASLDFTIPQGPQGSQGNTGSMNQTPNMTAGPQGPQGLMNQTPNMTASNLDTSQFLFLNGSRTMTGNLSMGGYNISNLGSPVASSDAATKAYVDSAGGVVIPWTMWSPSLTWSTGTPSGVSTIARYTQIGKVITFTIDITSTDSNGCTGLTVSLPVAPANNGNRIAVTSIENVGSS
jgi:hypothetical protein